MILNYDVGLGLRNSRPSPGNKTCFMSIDEIARIFSKSQSLYRRGEFGKAFIGTWKKLEIKSL